MAQLGGGDQFSVSLFNPSLFETALLLTDLSSIVLCLNVLFNRRKKASGIKTFLYILNVIICKAPLTLD